MMWIFLKGLFLTDSLVGYMLTLLFTSVSVKAQDIHRALGEYPDLFTSTSVNNYSLFTFWYSCVRVRALFFRYKPGIFHYFRAFKTKIPHIYSLTGQILKQLSPSVSVTSVRYLSRRSALIITRILQKQL